jgi:hypothetical protein
VKWNQCASPVGTTPVLMHTLKPLIKTPLQYPVPKRYWSFRTFPRAHRVCTTLDASWN